MSRTSKIWWIGVSLVAVACSSARGEELETKASSLSAGEPARVQEVSFGARAPLRSEFCYCDCRGPSGRSLYWEPSCGATGREWRYLVPPEGCGAIDGTPCESQPFGRTTWDYYGSACASSLEGTNTNCN
jgi:hypothetical protein